MNDLNDVKRRQKEGFALGFLGGGGIISAIIFGLYHFFKLSPSKKKHYAPTDDGKGPESFEL